MATKGWGKSKVTRESLLPYVASGVIPEFNRERWRVPPADGGTPPAAGEFVIFLSFLDRGFALPTSDFLRQLLAFYSIKVSDLGPHSVQQISLFVALCECYLACPPYFPLWVSIFHGRATRASKGGEALIPNGGITFQVKSGESFIDMALPKKAHPEPIPRRLNVRSLPHEQEEVVKEMRQAIQALKDNGLTAVNVYNCWLGRRLIPLRCRAHPMWEYRGQSDRTRSSATEWDESEYRKALAKITTATFTSFEDGLQPYSEDTPAPQVMHPLAEGRRPPPPLAGKEPPEMTEGEEEAIDDEEERTESDSEARDFIRLPRGSKRGAGSSSQDAAEEEATSRPEGEAELPKEGVEPLSKRLRPTLLEGTMRLQRPLKATIDAGARAGPGVKAIPTVQEEDLGKAGRGRSGHEGGRGEEEGRGEESGAFDLGGTGSAPGEPATASQAEKASASRAEPTAEVFPLPSMVRGGMASTATGPDIVPPVVEEESIVVGSTEAKAPEVEENIVEEGCLSGPKERRSKAARDRAPPSGADAGGRGTVDRGEAQAKALAEAREGFVKESLYREADFRAQQAEEARKRAAAEVVDLTKVLEKKGRELEDVIAEYKGKLETVNARDSARGAAASLREEVAALKQQHAKELAAEREASEGIVLAVQPRRPASRPSSRCRGRFLSPSVASRPGPVPEHGESAGGQSPSVASRLRGPVPEHGESASGAGPRHGESASGASPRAWRADFGGQSPSMANRFWASSYFPRPCVGGWVSRGDGDSTGMLVDHDHAYHRLCGGDIGGAPVPESAGGDSAGHAVCLQGRVQYSGRCRWLRRSSCRVGITMALSMVLAHYSEGFDVEEVTAGFPSETGEFDVAEVLRLMDAVRPFADRVLAMRTWRLTSPARRRLGTRRRSRARGLPCGASLPCRGGRLIVYLPGRSVHAEVSSR
ncbi:hypothetical protein QYE76_027051 [Lolium multiflorum]|uniref:Transposase (putative) gypsy type domain-containing protein n=1 Tax=Lolium multiflorum TaxID=4521 RepID=A0AAD8QGZ6_LOLMU|nr:hypothetical protein QYE76_027051 [Lolium multiflorum]